MTKKIITLVLGLFIFCAYMSAQEKSGLQERAEAEEALGKTANARSLWIQAFHDYASGGKTAQAVESGIKGTQLYIKDGVYKEAFELLQKIDQTIAADRNKSAADGEAWRYKTSRERMVMYMKMWRKEKAKEHMDNMEKHAAASNNDEVQTDLLYNKAIYFYTFGQISQGDAVFKEMASKLTTSSDYSKVDDVYQTLIATGRKSGNANMVSQAYTGYMVWKDSISALKAAEEVNALNQKINAGLASIAEKDSSLASRQRVIIGLCILAAILAAVLVVGAITLLRFIALTRKQKKTIKDANDNIALKAKFISNISSQLAPTLQKLDAKKPEVKALLDFSTHIQTLSNLETSMNEKAELEETPLAPFCEEIISQIRDKVKSGVNVTMDAPKMTAPINKEYVSYILLHLLNNAVEFTPEGGHISLDFKKRGAHKHQFIVSNTGSTIPEENRENVFKPFLEVKDLTKGDGLGLPICKQMAVKMNGDLEIDPQFTKGTRFVLNLET